MTALTGPRFRIQDLLAQPREFDTLLNTSLIILFYFHVPHSRLPGIELTTRQALFDSHGGGTFNTTVAGVGSQGILILHTSNDILLDETTVFVKQSMTINVYGTGGSMCSCIITSYSIVLYACDMCYC